MAGRRRPDAVAGDGGGTVRRDEGGATLPLVGLLIVVLFLAAAMAVDIGALGATNRRVQAVADLGALAGARELDGRTCSAVWPNVQAAVLRSVAANGFAVGGDRNLDIQLGTVAGSSPRVFQPLGQSSCPGEVPAAVRVVAGDRTGFGFGRLAGLDGRSSSRWAAAGAEPQADFEIGTSLATMQARLSSSGPSQLSLANTVLSRMLCPPGTTSCTTNLTAAGYQGLATTSVPLRDLQLALGFGTPQEMLQATVTVRRLFEAAAVAAGCTSTSPPSCSTVAGLELAGLSTAVNAQSELRLGRLLHSQVGGEEFAGGAVNAFNLVAGTAQVVNGTNTVSMPDVGVALPGVASSTLSLSLVEGPRYCADMRVNVPDPACRTSQVRSGSTLSLTLDVLGLVRVSGPLPVVLEAAGASGMLAAAYCAGDPKAIDVAVAAHAARVTVGTADLGVRLIGGLLDVATVRVSGNHTAAGETTSVLGFTHPVDFDVPRHVGATELGLQSTPLQVSVTSGVLPVGVTVADILAAVQGVLGSLDGQVLAPLLTLLGLDVGGADVTARDLDCSVQRLLA